MSETRDPSPSTCLPMTRSEMDARGWDALDVLLVTGDAYVDHPAFGIAIIGRVLEAAGYRVGIVSRPDWKAPDGRLTDMGRPRLFAGVSSGCVDSMLSLYTAARRPRRDDPYAPGGEAGGLPRRAVIVYANLVRQAFPGLPVVIGGVEASLRRLAHYDYWSDSVRRSILFDAKADLLVHGMGEQSIVEIARRLDQGLPLDDIAGTARAVRAEDLPADAVRLPSFDQVRDDKAAFMDATKTMDANTNPLCADALAQEQTAGRYCLVHPPAPPLATAQMDAVYDLPFTRRAHPSYEQPIPALEPVRFSITVVRGCFGGCAFCSLGLHQGKIIQSRSQESVLREARRLTADPDFRGTITDLGGPTANMYMLGCRSDEAARRCRRPSCLAPSLCGNLQTNHRQQIELLRAVQALPGVRHVFISSGVRHDLALMDLRYLEALVKHHVSGHLKIAPEHVLDQVLTQMRKPPVATYDAFREHFERLSRQVGKQQYLLPYLMAGHPGMDAEAMKELEIQLRQRNMWAEQAQEFLPSPMTMSTAMYHTGLDPATGRPLSVPRSDRQRREEKDLLTRAPGRQGGGGPSTPARAEDRTRSASSRPPRPTRPAGDATRSPEGRGRPTEAEGRGRPTEAEGRRRPTEAEGRGPSRPSRGSGATRRTDEKPLHPPRGGRKIGRKQRRKRQ